ncbi:TetR/AcrR family transcriptional regulator [Amycolatopsis pithecellobii]|uniref:TetR/AcrR family transcriptional regulator n=1 Tax=Amycolatopsis pithecellobii TaxID=664692 RepID=UPI00140C9944|nr:TetR/AcrR family transcriptional regulator [Amycolatopsis pithecellobii]
MATQKERNAETRRRLLSAARQVFAENGYANATVADIVKRAGRAHGSFYLHFTNKEAALQALLEDAMAGLAVDSRTLWRWDEPELSVRKSVHRFVEEFGENRDLWLLLDQRSSLEPAFKKMSDQWFEQLSGGIVRAMLSTEAPGLLPSLDPEILAHVFAAMLSDSTRAAYQESQSWTTGELADEISSIWSRTLGYTEVTAAAEDGVKPTRPANRRRRQKPDR